MTSTLPWFSHLTAMTDGVGLFEHALLDSPRPEHGYCVDDVARGLIAVCRADITTADPGTDGAASTELARLAWVYARFLESAQQADGRVVNRRDVHGVPHGEPTLDDCWGRSLWALGTAAARTRDELLARRAADLFAISAVRRSRWSRAMAFAGLGAAELLRIDPTRQDARGLLRAAAATVGPFRPSEPWPWPWPRLTYANAVLPDVLMAAGDCLNDGALVDQGLAMLDWLVSLQLQDGQLSLVPAAGWATGEPQPGFDQQPIEASTLADACARAFDLTGDARWSAALDATAGWFFGRNDAQAPLYDPVTAGCCDGLEPHGRNENQGAESTLAFITTIQHTTRLSSTAA